MVFEHLTRLAWISLLLPDCAVDSALEGSCAISLRYPLGNVGSFETSSSSQGTDLCPAPSIKAGHGALCHIDSKTVDHWIKATLT